MFSGLSPDLLVWTVLGVAAGVIVGSIPGLTGAMVIALTLPLTFSMTPEAALVLLVSMYVGSVSGGLVSATLLRMPGTPASIMTTLDGYPMAESGRARRALTLGIGASFVGGVLSWAALVLLAGPVAVWSTHLAPADMFSLVCLALVLIAVVSRESLLRGLFSGMLGILLALPGMHPATGQTRLTFGLAELDDGFKLLPVLIGLFAVSQALRDCRGQAETGRRLSVDDEGAALSGRDWRTQIGNLLRSSVIGTAVGILPGIGANIGSVLAYGAARSRSRTPEAFGTGCDEGVVASESANNATVGGALVPLVALGIPGSVIDAILLGAFMIHGLQPGPLLFENNPDIVHTITDSYLVANFVMFAFMLMSVRWIARLSAVPRGLLVPVVLTFCVLGSYALANRMFDVWVMLGFGVLGLIMEWRRIPLAPFVIGFVLAPIAEENLCAALMISGGDWTILVQRPISAILLLLSLSVPFTLLVRLRRVRGEPKR